MSNWQIKDHTEDRWIDVDNRRDGEDKLEDFEGELELELKAPDGRTVDTNFDMEDTSDTPGETLDAKIVDHSPAAQESDPTMQDPEPGKEPTPKTNDTPDGQDLPDRSVTDDPFEWMPGDFIDEIQGTQAINRKGYAVLSQFYDISVSSECIVGPEETDFTYARCEATAVGPDGETYKANGSAHVDRQDGDDPTLLLELADTRATKRVLAIATGVGAVAVEELKNEL